MTIKSKKTARRSNAKSGLNARRSVITSVKPNPRREGTRAYDVYDQMEKAVRKNKNLTVSEIFAKTDYASRDFGWDVRHDNIKIKIVASK